MIRFFLISLLFVSSSVFSACDNLLDYSHQQLRSNEKIDLCERYSGKVLLIVNTASKCGFTPQFEQLEALYQRYRAEGLVVLGFPSDNFFQEYDSSEETAEVCYVNYGVTFPMFASSNVHGRDANPLFRQLSERSDTSVKWNFYKFLVARDGKHVEAFNSRSEPLGGALEQAIKRALSQDQ
ncbi:glutathione peroxidase [Sinobacterium caligoides]|uniref:Glutathione peroxidase n=1 Tax=Sinobacterium caligoides TaxID=933926 RepID=A0A3N2DYL6_9GAMM|nr:glutathione peroxidase [Sinobacterium caligoides]ROS04941.1 glutathione peroxidase [Sinobacterium caligoides]